MLLVQHSRCLKKSATLQKFLDTTDEYRQVLVFLPVLLSDDEDDNIFELERNFSDVFDTFVNEYCIKKDKNEFKFLFRFHNFPKISKMFETHVLEKFTFQHFREIKMSRNITFWSNREIKMLQNIVFGLNREVKMPRNPNGSCPAF